MTTYQVLFGCYDALTISFAKMQVYLILFTCNQTLPPPTKLVLKYRLSIAVSHARIVYKNIFKTFLKFLLLHKSPAMIQTSLKNDVSQDRNLPLEKQGRTDRNHITSIICKTPQRLIGYTIF